MKLKLRDAAILLILISIYYGFYSDKIPDNCFGYDEADYMYAAGKGYAANWFDDPSISLGEFIRLGRSKGTVKTEKTSISEYIRNSGDITFYRHYHGPLNFYWLNTVKKCADGSEYTIRLLSALLFVFTLIAVYYGCLYSGLSDSRMFPVITSALFVVGSANAKTSLTATPHTMYVFFLLIGLFLLTKFIADKNKYYLYGLAVTACCAALSIKYSVLLILTIILSLLIFRKELKAAAGRKEYLTAVLVFAGVFFILWPGGIIRLTIIKNYLMMAYLTVVKSKELFSNIGMADIWYERFIQSPAEYLLLVAGSGVFLYQFFRKKRFKELFPFFLYSVLIFLTTFRNKSLSPTYISSLLPPLYVICAAVITDVLKTFPYRKIV